MNSSRASIVVQCFCYCFVVGTIVGFYDVLPFQLMVGWLVVAVLIFTASIVLQKELMWCVFGMMIGLWLGVVGMKMHHAPNIFASQFGTAVSFEGVVATEPVRSAKSQTITIRPDGVESNVRASIYTPIHTQVGDRVWVRGQLEPPENFSDFNYVGYLERHNVAAVIKQPRVIVLKRGPLGLHTTLVRLKSLFVRRAEAVLNTNSSSLVLGMLIGYRQSLPEEVQENFRKTGLSHIVAVSGSNMTIVATTLGVLAWVVGRRKADALSLGIIVVFTILTGASAAVVRAAIMAILMLVARIFGRAGSSYTMLLFASVLMLLHNPLLLFYDIGFQLSVVATLGVLGAMQLAAQWEKEGFWVELLYPTMGAIVMTAPIVAYHFGTISIIAPVANAVVLPFISIIMALGFASLLPWVSIVAVPIVELIITLELWFVAIAASLPWSSASWQPHGAIVFSYYMFVFLLMKILLKNDILPPLNSDGGYVKMSKITI